MDRGSEELAWAFPPLPSRWPWLVASLPSGCTALLRTVLPNYWASCIHVGTIAFSEDVRDVVADHGQGHTYDSCGDTVCPYGWNNRGNCTNSCCGGVWASFAKWGPRCTRTLAGFGSFPASDTAGLVLVLLRVSTLGPHMTHGSHMICPFRQDSRHYYVYVETKRVRIDSSGRHVSKVWEAIS